ncbi:MAG: FKBP-type peptidyl-prolyl cis-trans isomerase [Arenimonas sp.]
MLLARIVFTSVFLLSSMQIAAAVKAPSTGELPADAIESASGMHYKILQAAKPGAASVKPDFFEYRVTIWTKNEAGKLVARDSGSLRSNFKTVAQTTPALARAVLMSPIGEIRRWWFSVPNAAGQFQIVDLTVLGNIDPAPAPADVSAVPANANKTASGLAYRVIKKGNASDGSHPTLQSIITIDYSGWTPDGKLFDSSVTRGEKATFPLSGLISGWKEGLTLMSPGDTYRFWIPGHLAYDSIPNSTGPKGMLVFDVTLYSFE